MTHAIIILSTFVLGFLCAKLFRYIVPRFYLVCVSSMEDTLEDMQVVMGFKIYPDEPLNISNIYGYKVPGRKKIWLIKRLAHHEGGLCCFLGDNSDDSWDSRHHGLIDRKSIMFEVYWYKGKPKEV